MSLINRVKEITNNVVDSGKERMEAVRDTRRRNALLTELGELTYRKHKGHVVDETAMDPVIAELDKIGWLDAPVDAGTESDDAGDGPDGDDDTDEE